MSTTRKDLEMQFVNMCNTAVKAGVAEAVDWRLEIGSKTYGRAYRIWLTKHNGTGAHYTPTVSEFLGMTANEAQLALQHLRSAFLAVVWARDDA